MSDIPPTPKSESKEDLGFTKQPMTGWFDPVQLVRTGVNAVLSEIFGAYADNREMQAALRKPQVHDYSDKKDLWLDYVADVGDGWNSTYTMAKLLSEKKLTLTYGEKAFNTQRGSILVLGGDQVYPAATRQSYQDHTVGPYQAAMSYTPPPDHPHLFAIPGNHDWYDGLTSFSRLFCQDRWIGGWKTRQSRSYFAMKLAHRWWLWGLDVQLASDIDHPQLQFFEEVAKENMRPGDQVILCTAEPSWVYTVTRASEAYDNLAFFDRSIIQKYGGNLKLTLTGDLHHYSRYEDPSGQHQKITAGGGGAYLYGTHRLPEKIYLTKDKQEFQRKALFPSIKESLHMTWGVLRFPFKNLRFSRMLCALYLLFAWILQSATKPLEATFMEQLVKMNHVSLADFNHVLMALFTILKHSPTSVVMALGIIGGLIVFCDSKKTFVRFAAGGLHGVLHILLNISLIWVFSCVNLCHTPVREFFGITDVDQVRQVLLFSAEMFTFGGFFGGLLMGLYLFLCDRLLRIHSNEVFSAQAIENYKNFLRIHIDSSGGLTIYPVGVEKVCKSWKLRPEAKNGESWFEPTSPKDAPKLRLIEEPIHIDAPADQALESPLVQPTVESLSN